MTQVDTVRRRLVYAEHKRDIDSAVDRFAWDRDLIIDGLLMCGDMAVLNAHWTEWRRRTAVQVGHPRGRAAQRMFHTFLREQESLRRLAAQLQEGR